MRYVLILDTITGHVVGVDVIPTRIDNITGRVVGIVVIPTRLYNISLALLTNFWFFLTTSTVSW